jgi:hypothetical protein
LGSNREGKRIDDSDDGEARTESMVGMAELEDDDEDSMMVEMRSWVVVGWWMRMPAVMVLQAETDDDDGGQIEREQRWCRCGACGAGSFGLQRKKKRMIGGEWRAEQQTKKKKEMRAARCRAGGGLGVGGVTEVGPELEVDRKGSSGDRRLVAELAAAGFVAG